MIDNVLAKDINELEPRLIREDYNVKVLAELLNAIPAGPTGAGPNPGFAE